MKRLLTILCLLPALALAQKPNWQNLDLKTDSTFGISTEKAYTELLKGKTSKTVTVAVIDAGIDTMHEDLKAVLWNNPKPKKDDRHGWGFIGGKDGNVHYDNLELTRQVRQGETKYAHGDTSDFIAYYAWKAQKAELQKKLAEDQKIVRNIGGFKKVLEGMCRKIGQDSLCLAGFRAFQPTGPAEQQVRNIVIANLQQKDDFKTFENDQIEKPLEHYRAETDYQLNTAYDPRTIVGDDYFKSQERNYGNNDVMGADPTHGTHVSGIIAAVRDNNLGIRGVADNVRIMAIRTVPDGDERDKDVANAIRYAADHGAKVINMSFGKPYSQDKKAVDEAVKYALKKDVLLVQAAGNENENIDLKPNFPDRKFENGQVAGAWIVVGASGWKADENLKASFSNYGKTAVDVFAPGEKIKSCIPGSKYAEFDGTSMACPVVAGLAALIREYYPKLKAAEVKDIILKSVVKVDHPVKLDKNLVPFTDLCRTGGIVNAYQALQLAAVYKR